MNRVLMMDVFIDPFVTHRVEGKRPLNVMHSLYPYPKQHWFKFIQTMQDFIMGIEISW